MIKIRYFIEVGHLSLNKYKEELCGDKVEYEALDDGVVAVLSDGLGSGVKANILATLTSKIAMTMVKNGCNIEEVLNTIMSTLPVCKERNLAYSTFSIMYMLYDGMCYIARFDNPPILLKRGETVTTIEDTNSQIIDEKVKEVILDLKEGDFVISISDGVLNAGVGTVLNLGWDINSISTYISMLEKDLSATSLCKKIISICDGLYEQEPGDDTTVVVCKVTKPTIVNVLTGPPLNDDDDSFVVGKFISTKGKKLVCGGTAAKIVARELNQDIQLDMGNINADVPPIGYINGIDLVTEGVLTLKRVVEVLEDYKYSKYHIDELFEDKKNGAYLILKTFLDECNIIRFFLGRRINKAHKNINFPKDLCSKVEIIKKIKEKLEEMGKIVYIDYY